MYLQIGSVVTRVKKKSNHELLNCGVKITLSHRHWTISLLLSANEEYVDQTVTKVKPQGFAGCAQIKKYKDQNEMEVKP